MLRVTDRTWTVIPTRNWMVTEVERPDVSEGVRGRKAR
jgi:hypothetical protein